MSALAFDIPRDEFFEQCVKHLLCPAYITEQDLYDAVKTVLDGKHCTSNISKLSNNNKPYIIHYLSLQDYIDMGAFPLPRYRLSITSAPGVTFDSLQLPDFFEEFQLTRPRGTRPLAHRRHEPRLVFQLTRPRGTRRITFSRLLPSL